MVMKDKNLWMMDEFLISTNVDKFVISLPVEVKLELDEIIKYDSMFLRNHGIMDYSTYLVVERFGGSVVLDPTRHEYQSN